MEFVLNRIENLLTEFTPNPIPFPDQRIKLDDPFMNAFDHLRMNIKGDKRDRKVQESLVRYQEARHYSHNIWTLLYFFLHYLRNYPHDEHIRSDFHSRLTLDLEKLLTDTRSFLDSMLKLTLLYAEDVEIAVKGDKRKSFGKFATWAEKSDITFAPPLSYMKELTSWGLTIRQVRDDYVHRGQEAQPFWGKDDVFFNPYTHDRHVRRLPSLFYPSKHPNRLRTDPDLPVYLRKFIVYVVAPILALEQTLGRYFDDLFAVRYDPWPRHGIGHPYRTGSHIQALFDFIEQNSDVLDPEIYTRIYLISEDNRGNVKKGA